MGSAFISSAEASRFLTAACLSAVIGFVASGVEKKSERGFDGSVAGQWSEFARERTDKRVLTAYAVWPRPAVEENVSDRAIGRPLVLPPPKKALSGCRKEYDSAAGGTASAAAIVCVASYSDGRSLLERSPI